VRTTAGLRILEKTQIGNETMDPPTPNLFPPTPSLYPPTPILNELSQFHYILYSPYFKQLVVMVSVLLADTCHTLQACRSVHIEGSAAEMKTLELELFFDIVFNSTVILIGLSFKMSFKKKS
jgi:hypothetical protein